MPFPDALARDLAPKIIFFTDFDGTITLQDTNDYITATHGMGEDGLIKITKAIGDGSLTFRDGFTQELVTWSVTIPEALEVLKRDIKLDPHFIEFAEFARENKIPVVVVSSGMVPIISEMLKHLLGADLARDIEIVANNAIDSPASADSPWKKGWKIDFRDETDFGHDKSRAIRPYANAIAKMGDAEEKPILLYAGDGVSDLSAARETDLLFAKEGKDLVNYCIREGIKYVTFRDWKSILKSTGELLEGTTSVKKLAAEQT